MRGANLSYADLTGANLRDAAVGGVIFKYTNLDGVDFRGAENLLKAYWAHSKNLETALFSDDKTRNAVLKLKLEQENADANT